METHCTRCNNEPTLYFSLTNCHLYHCAGNNPVRYIDPDGRIVLIGSYDDEFKDSVLELLNDACKVSPYFKRIFMKMNDNKDIIVKIDQVYNCGDIGTTADDWEAYKQNIPTGSRIDFCPDRFFIQSENLMAEPLAILVHELGHAYEMMEGLYNPYADFIDEKTGLLINRTSESIAVDLENMVRVAKGLEYRSTYAGHRLYLIPEIYLKKQK